MLGFALAVLGYRVSGLNVWQQFKSAPGMPTRLFDCRIYSTTGIGLLSWQ